MGLYSIRCRQCGEFFVWFSGNLDQRCSTCKGTEPVSPVNLTEDLPRKYPPMYPEHFPALGVPFGGAPMLNDARPQQGIRPVPPSQNLFAGMQNAPEQPEPLLPPSKFWTRAGWIFYAIIATIIFLALLSGFFPKIFLQMPLPNDQLGHNSMQQRDAQGRSQTTETLGTCTDAGRVPIYVGEQFVGCYACTPGQAGETCTRK